MLWKDVLESLARFGVFFLLNYMPYSHIIYSLNKECWRFKCLGYKATILFLTVTLSFDSVPWFFLIMKTIVNNQTINSLWAFLLRYDEYLSSGTSNINNCSTTSLGPVISAGFGKHYNHQILVLSNAVYSTCYYLVAICS